MEMVRCERRPAERAPGPATTSGERSLSGASPSSKKDALCICDRIKGCIEHGIDIKAMTEPSARDASRLAWHQASEEPEGSNSWESAPCVKRRCNGVQKVRQVESGAHPQR
jgi:hypothetical protein